jgi:hypothetical protein
MTTHRWDENGRRWIAEGVCDKCGVDCKTNLFFFHFKTLSRDCILYLCATCYDQIMDLLNVEDLHCLKGLKNKNPIS